MRAEPSSSAHAAVQDTAGVWCSLVHTLVVWQELLWRLPDLRSGRRAQNKPRRNFVQTFFLAVQEKGYFVLNDLFRYLPEPTSAQPPQSAAAPAPAAAQEDGHYGGAGGGAALQAQHVQVSALRRAPDRRRAALLARHFLLTPARHCLLT